MLDPQSLRAFIAIAEDRHFARAADRLALAQSVVSKRLQRLEDQLGARLIDRGGKAEVRLTRNGALFLDEARSALAALEQAERNARRHAMGLSGPIRIGYVFSAALCGVLPRLLAAIRSRIPGVEPLLEPLDTPSQLAAIEAGRIDIALIRPRPSYPDVVRATTIHREPVVIALGINHPLAVDGQLRRADLAAETFIVPQFHEEVGLINAISDLSRQGGFPMPTVVSTRDFISAACMAAAGAGVVLAPASLATLQLDGVVYRPLADHAASMDLVMLARQDLPEGLVDVAVSVRDAPHAHPAYGGPP